jgi:hypothetical protein
MSSNADDALVASSSDSYQVTTVGLRFSGVMPYEEWESLGPTLGKGARGYSWSIGDWLVYGEWKFGEKYAQAMESTGLSLGRLRNLSWLANKVPIHVRHEALSMSHHEAVAPLPVKHQMTMLDIAEANGWDRDTLRESVAEVLAGVDPKDTDSDVIEQKQHVITPDDIMLAARNVAEAWRTNSPRGQVGMTLHASLEELAELLGGINAKTNTG